MASADLHIFHLCLRIVVKNVGDRLSTTIGVEADTAIHGTGSHSIKREGVGRGGHFYSPLSTIEWDTIKTSSFKKRDHSFQ